MIRRPSSIIIASDGLSDPFEDDDDIFEPLGYLVEVCVEAPLDSIDGDNIAQSWLFDLIYQLSQNVADHGSIDLLVQRHGSVSMALDLQSPPDGLEDGNEQVGILIDASAPTIPASFATPYGDVMMLTATVLQPAELAHIGEAQDRAGARAALAQALAASPTGRMSVAGRPAVTLP